MLSNDVVSFEQPDPESKVYLDVKKSGSAQGHHLNDLGSTGEASATYQIQAYRSTGSGEEDF